MAASSELLTVEDVLKDYPENTLKLNLPKKNIECIEYIGKFRCVERIDLSQNAVVNADHLSDCVKLKWLNISKNHICSLGFVKGLAELSVLNAAHNEIEEIGIVKKLKNLKALILNNNRISSPVSLHTLKLLNTLVLSHNCISEIDVSPLVALVKLQLSHNVMKTFPSIKNNRDLKSLLLNDNEISRVPEDCLGETKLEILDLGKNQIKKFKHVSALCAVETLSNLNLKGCPLDQSDMYRDKVMHLFPGLKILDYSRPMELENKDKIKPDNGHIEGVKEPKRKKEDCSEDDLNVEAIRPPKKKKKHKTLESVPSEDMEIDGGIHDQLSTPVHHPASDTKLVDKKSRTTEETGSKHGHDDLKSEKKKSKKKKSKSKESESGVVAIKDYTKKRKGGKPDAISLFSSGVQIGSGLESSW